MAVRHGDGAAAEARVARAEAEHGHRRPDPRHRQLVVAHRHHLPPRRRHLMPVATAAAAHQIIHGDHGEQDAIVHARRGWEKRERRGARRFIGRAIPSVKAVDWFESRLERAERERVRGWAIGRPRVGRRAGAETSRRRGSTGRWCGPAEPAGEDFCCRGACKRGLTVESGVARIAIPSQ